MEFKYKLHKLRKEKKMSKEMLEEKMRVSRQAIAKWEGGQCYPDIEKLIDLSEYFKVSIDKLVKDSCYEQCTSNDVKDTTEKGWGYNQEVIDFLCRAKINCYAGGSTETQSSRPESHDLQYEEGDLKYIDTYLGGEKFAGEEALWHKEKPIWAMNYVGRIVAEGFSSSFLMECLRLVPKEIPFRGPLYYQNGDYAYHCIINGEFSWFHGYEEIFCRGVKVYECNFHGGYISE